MAETVPLLGIVQGIHRDLGRDGVPPNHLWDMADLVPQHLGANLRARGPWTWRSPVLAYPPDSMIFANFKAGHQLLVSAYTNTYAITHQGLLDANTVTTSGPQCVTPVFHRDLVIMPDYRTPPGTPGKPRYYLWDGSAYTTGLLDDLSWDDTAKVWEPGAPDNPMPIWGRFAAVYKDRLVLAGSWDHPNLVTFSKAGMPNEFNTLSQITTSQPITGLIVNRGSLLVFHNSSVERIRGDQPPDSTATDQRGDMWLEPLFDRVGAFEARTICSWNDLVLFADARGIHLADAGAIKNLVEEGGIAQVWREQFQELTSDTGIGFNNTAAAVVYRDYYIICLRSVTTTGRYTWVCHIPTRRFWRFTNIDASCFAYSGGRYEYLFASHSADKRVTDLGGMFMPNEDRLDDLVDANGVAIQPIIESGWTKFRGEKFRRVFQLQVSYETNANGGGDALDISYRRHPLGGWLPLTPLKHALDYAKRKIPVRRRQIGFAYKVEVVDTVTDFRLHQVEALLTEEEGTTT